MQHHNTTEDLATAVALWQDALAKRNAAHDAAQAAYRQSVATKHSDEAHKAHLAAYDVWYHAQVALQSAHGKAQALYTASKR